MNWPAERKLALGFGLGLLVLAANAGFSLRNTRDLVRSGDVVVHTYKILNLLDAVISTVRNAEATQRAYLITNDETELEEFQRTRFLVEEQVEILRRATRDNPGQQGRIAEMLPAIRTALGILRETAEIRRRRGFLMAQAEVLSGESRMAIAEALRHAEGIRAEEVRLIELRTRDLRGRIWHALVTFSIASAAGLGLIAVLSKILRRHLAERRRAAEAIQASNAQVRLLLDSTGEGIYGIDEQGRCTFCNATALKLLGYDGDAALLGRNMHALIHHTRADGSPFPAETCPIYRAFRKGVETCSDDDVFIRADGSALPVEYWARPIRLDGRVLGAVITFGDIAPRRKAEVERRLRDRALQAIAQGIFITDPKRHDEPIIDVNEAMEHLTGYAREELLGRDVPSFAGAEADPNAVAALADAIREGRGCSVELPMDRKDGSSFWAFLSLSPVEDASGRVTHFVGVVSDVTEKKRQKEEMRLAKESAEVASRAKSAFLANMSHELRTPLNAVIGYSEMLKEEAEAEGRPESIPDLEKIHGAGKHLLDLINDILDLSKIEAGKMELYLETFDVADLARAAVATVAPLASRRGNAVRVECDGDGPGAMLGDQTKVRQSLLNLLSNAIKFTEGGEVVVRAGRERGEDGDRVVLSVVDSGIGMSAEELARLFRPFTQADASTTRRYGGTGLGLTITRRFCQMMGGDVGVTSVPGLGSTFTLRLPARVVPRKAEAEPAAAPPDAPAAEDVAFVGAGVGTVLVIDDDPAVRDILGRMLRKEGFRVASASGGEDGLELARRLRPDAITLDVMMPGLDGWGVLAALKSDPALAEIPVIMATIVDDKNLGYALGASDYLTKPIDRARLSRVLRRHRRDLPGGMALVVEDDPLASRTVRQALEADGWCVAEARDGRAGLARMDESAPDLIVLDLMMPGMDGFAFMEALRDRPGPHDAPVIVITARDITAADRARLNGRVSAVLMKGAYTRDDLLAQVRREVADRLRPAAAVPQS